MITSMRPQAHCYHEPMPARTLLSIALLVALTTLVNCSKEQRALFGTLQETQGALAAEFQPAEVGLNLVNSNRLVVQVFNSRFNTTDEATRSAQARKAAEIAIKPFKEVKDVQVTFIQKAGGMGVSVSNTIASYQFAAADLRQSPK